MKFYMFFLFILLSNDFFAQSNCTIIDCDSSICPTYSNNECDVTITNTNLNSISANTIYCLGGNVTIQANIPSGTIIYINPGAIVNTQNVNNFEGAIINCGTFNQGNSNMGNGSSTIENYGIFNTSQNTLTSNNDIVINYASGTFNVLGSWNVEDSEVVNCGSINQTNQGGNIRVKQGSCFKNNTDADIYLEGNFIVENGSNLDNFGLITAEKDININSGANVYNACSLHSYTKITLDGNVVNDALIISDDPNNNSPMNGQEQIQVSNGTFTNNGLVVGNEFLNNGTVTGDGGLFHFLGNTNNNTTVAGTGTGLNFYDVSNSNGLVFDTGFPPTNTTAIAFTPNDLNTLLDDCGQTIALPIELSDFFLNYDQRTNTIVLEWVTEQEINADKFELFYSKDGSNWKLVYVIKAMNSGQTTTEYKYQIDALKGYNYFRLKLIDIDGTYSFSDIINHNSITNFGIIKAYPNPISRNETLLVEGLKSPKIALVNVLGEKLFEFRIDPEKETNYLSLPELPVGLYMIIDDNKEILISIVD